MGDTLGIRGKNKKKSQPCPLKKKKHLDPSRGQAEPSHWLHATFISKTVCHHFWPGLMAGAQTVGHGYLND